MSNSKRIYHGRIPRPNVNHHRPRRSFAGLRVAITGGTSGLGLALVHELLNRGAQVAFVARGREGVDVSARPSRRYGIVGDVSKSRRFTPSPYRSWAPSEGSTFSSTTPRTSGRRRWPCWPTRTAKTWNAHWQPTSRPFSTHQSAPRLARRRRARRPRQGGRKYLERRCDNSLPALGRLRREQSRPASFEPHLERRTHRPGNPRTLRRSRRYGHALHAVAVPDAIARPSSSPKSPRVKSRKRSPPSCRTHPIRAMFRRQLDDSRQSSRPAPVERQTP